MSTPKSTPDTQNQSTTASTIYADLAQGLAVASTLCIVGNPDAVKAGINLMLQACACAALHTLSASPDNASSQQGPADMYTVRLFERPNTCPEYSRLPFEITLHDLTCDMLALYGTQHALAQSQARTQIIEDILRQTQDPSDPVVQDAQLYKTLQKQATWYNLNKSLGTLNSLLCNIARANLQWHHFLLNLPNQDIFSSAEIGNTLRDAWQNNARYIEEYDLADFGIKDLDPLLKLLQQQPQFMRKPLLYNEESHRYFAEQLQNGQKQLSNLYAG